MQHFRSNDDPSQGQNIKSDDNCHLSKLQANVVQEKYIQACSILCSKFAGSSVSINVIQCNMLCD